MDAVLFLKERKRMCDSVMDCKNCPIGDGYISNYNPADPFTCLQYCEKNAEYVIPLVEQWSKEHPRKTRMQDFLEKFPKAQMNEDGIPEVCCKVIGYTQKCKSCNCGYCWNQPLEE